MNCPACSTEITAKDVSTDGKASCPSCGRHLRVRHVELREEPPDHCHVSRDEQGVVIIACNNRRNAVRGFGGALLVLIVGSLLVALVTHARYGTLAPLMNWPIEWRVPSRAMSGTPRHRVNEQTWLVVTVQISLLLCGTGAMTGLGRVEVRERGRLLRVQSGLPPVGWTRSFDISEIRWVRVGREYPPELISEDAQPDSPTVEMRVRERLVRFGRHLTPERRDWLVRTIAEEFRIPAQRV